MTVLQHRPKGRLRTAGDLVDALELRFSDEQLAAVTAPLEPAVIIAGAGSGKTTVMAARVVWLVGSGAVRPEQVLGLTFTRKAASELAQRIRRALVKAGVLSADGVDDEGEQVVMTYDSFAARLVSEHGLWLGYEGDPRIVTGASRFRLASRVVTTAAGPFDQLSRLRPDTVTDRVLGLDAQLQAHLVADEALDAQASRYLLELAHAPLNNRRNVYASVRAATGVARERLELASLVRAYQQLKRELGYVEFADQMAAAARLAREVPGVGAALRQQFRIVLLDEYQDTSSAQAVLLGGLFSGAAPGEGRGHPVTAVGDPFQAIYGWRGAAASNILQFPHDFPRTDGSPAAHLSLTVNRRSGPRILEVANRLAEPLRRDPTIAYDLSDAILRAPDGTAPGHVAAGTFESWPDEVTWIADRIVELGTVEGASGWEQIACLLRRNGDIGPLYSALVARDVPVEIVGLGGLLSVPEVADVVSVLQVLDDVTANPSLVRLLTGPRWRIGHGDLELLGRRARELARARPDEALVADDALTAALDAAVADADPTELVSLAEALADPGNGDYSPEARSRFARAAAEFDHLRRHTAEPVLDLLRRVVATLGLDVELATGTAPQPFAQLSAFTDAVAAYVDVDTDASLGGLLAYLRAESDHGAGLDQAVPSADDSVKLLTVHRAKGLEWDVVFLPALVDQVFPTGRVTDNWVKSAAALPAELRGDAATVPHLREPGEAGFQAYEADLKADLRRAEDRLAYVAVTRARQFLVATGHSWRVGDVRPKQPSPYLTVLLDAARAAGTVIAEAGPVVAVNPLETRLTAYEWPAAPDPEEQATRRSAAKAVIALRDSNPAVGDERRRVAEALAAAPSEVADLVAGWDDSLHRLVTEALSHHPTVLPVPLPDALSATNLVRAHRDPAAFAAALARPMPAAPSHVARFGTRFHEWVVRHFDSPMLVDPDDMVDRADSDAAGDEELAELCRAFAAGRFGEAVPAALEFPFSLPIGAQEVRGRIDAVYTSTSVVPRDRRVLVVDWKTGRSRPDPLQLGIYRLAWAELHGLPLGQVAAGFYHVRDDRLDLVGDLPDRTGIESLLSELAPGVA